MDNTDNTDNTMLQVGTILRDIYRIDGYLASGGFGNTYLATNVEFDEQVAIKEFFMKGVSHRNDDSSIGVSNSENIEMFDKLLGTFKREAKRLRALANKKCEHIIKVHDIFEENNTAYYVMQYIKGKSLSDILKAQNKPFDQSWLMDSLLPQMLEALDTIHSENMWHLDIKPSNIMLDDAGSAYLIDFGSSKQIDTSTGEPVTLSSTLSFTKTYAPFELQSYDIGSIGPWTDFYSLGATLYNLATNQKPPSAIDILNKESTAFKFAPGTSDDFMNLVVWMMKNKKENRPQSVAEIRTFLNKKTKKHFKGAASKPEPISISEPSQLAEEKTVSSKSVQHDDSQEKTILENPNKTPSPQPSKDKKNKSKKKIILIVASVAIVLGISLLLYNVIQSSSQPEISQPVKVEGSKDFTVNGVTFTMVPVDGGTFTMGATPEQGGDVFDQEKPAHSVTLSSFMIGQTEVTQELWQAVMGSNPSQFKGAKLPVEDVSWVDCQEFVKKLNQLTGQNFRLPTEAEWEYAARGGAKSQGYKYSGSDNRDDVAWYGDNDGGGPHAVGTKRPNELGLYDMSGNVWEWCQDWYGDYSSSAQTNPLGPTSGSRRVYRGGGWGDDARGCRVAIRYGDDAVNRNYLLGFRLAL